MNDASRRGTLKRTDKAMSQEDIDSLLNGAFCGRIATFGPDGYPYVVPNLFTWHNNQIYVHTARYLGHFQTNVRYHSKVSFEIDEAGAVFPYGPVECDTSVSYRSVIVFGEIRIVTDPDEQAAFYRGFMAKYAPADSWGRPKDSFPRMPATMVYAITPTAITGKHNPLPGGA